MSDRMVSCKCLRCFTLSNLFPTAVHSRKEHLNGGKKETRLKREEE